MTIQATTVIRTFDNQTQQIAENNRSNDKNIVDENAVMEKALANPEFRKVAGDEFVKTFGAKLEADGIEAAKVRTEASFRERAYNAAGKLSDKDLQGIWEKAVKPDAKLNRLEKAAMKRNEKLNNVSGLDSSTPPVAREYHNQVKARDTQIQQQQFKRKEEQRILDLYKSLIRG